MEFEFTEEKDVVLLKPKKALTDYEYDNIKETIEALGGHWREKVKAFVFSRDGLKRSEYSQWKENNQFFPTPQSVTNKMIELSGLEEYSSENKPYILEPSAGTGSIIRCIPTYIRKQAKLYAVEPNNKNARQLIRLGVEVDKRPFEDFYNEYKHIKRHITHVLMNPPFSLGRDIRHTLLAYELLQEGGVLVGVISENSLYYDNIDSTMFRKWLKEHKAYIEPLPYGSFKNSGTMIDTMLIKVIKQ